MLIARFSRVARTVLLLLLTAFLSIACTRPQPAWNVTDEAVMREVLPVGDTGEYARDWRPSEIPDLPPPNDFRPCCELGREIGVRMLGVPVVGMKVGQILDPADLGRHEYGNRLLKQASDEEGGLVTEKNGIAYACRGGFVDVGHARWISDWTVYVTSRIARLAETGGVIEVPEEGGTRAIYVEPFPESLVDEFGLPYVAIMTGRYLGFQLSIWHEIATWYGWSTAGAVWPERHSAFSPEDIYSNLLGAELAAQIMLERQAGSETSYNRSVDRKLAEILEELGALPPEATAAALDYVEGVWWDQGARLPSAHVIRRRYTDIGPSLSPWQVSQMRESVYGEVMRDFFCPAGVSPLWLDNADNLNGITFNSIARLEIAVRVKNQDDFPFPDPDTGIVTPADFPAIVAVAREQADEEFGPLATSPAATSASASAANEPVNIGRVTFRAGGHTPAWIIEFGDQATLFEADRGTERIVLPAVTSPMQPDRPQVAYSYTSDQHQGEIYIELRDCVDKVANLTFPARVSVTLDGRQFKGCGRYLNP